MTQTVSMPLWIFVLIVLFAAVTFASHFLFPSVRWFFRKRAERVIARLNERLQRPIEPFKLARRYDMIQRLIYDPDVTQAIVDHARQYNIPENVAFEQARRYAREIVPSFSATAYFSIGIRLARWLSTSLYKVKLGNFDRETLAHLDADSTVVFVINHRSNMDYVLVTYLAANAGALSYAVGEWARVWPLSFLIRAMGAYFIRRKSRGALYRKVLARYVQMATRGGVSQAVFPEGGLSLDGKIASPKLGIISYMIEDFDPARRDLIFVPVALNYDRVLEDTYLIAADKSGKRRFRPPLKKILKRLARHLWLRATRKFDGFGAASVSFGEPLALSEMPRDPQIDLPRAVAAEVMSRISAVVPVLDVPLVARHVLQGITEVGALERAVEQSLVQLGPKTLPAKQPDSSAVVKAALAQLEDRGILSVDAETGTIRSEKQEVLAYYANSIIHHFEGAEAVPSEAKDLARN
ncbi:1-acyl-sn-glycerol-3-phosphate acyltransferase [Yoonia sediminilitoris]|uniref:Glycerol-3-phosphate acyltransferase n=1 Tax=Yoonia sediminilitoris TaxID=1286148 RepID=A0A2T6KK80_9RHOB|nr:1-acyl-sn-glycerol-3-phosphate acyltransferase [Yoonia sediminilitoris]PUB16377.1 glycerol-3-phosphate acyltransferase [Yoonia sediminilitoris]RCW96726.1 glycerol-3-phosphate acyltransferase [Yoonia sediminilitoris]